VSASAGQVRDWHLDEKIAEFLRPWSEGGQAEGSGEFISHCLGFSRVRVDAALADLEKRGVIYSTCTGRYRLTTRGKIE
jgi:Mn-dependent DtxR family transcriptional regulator